VEPLQRSHRDARGRRRDETEEQRDMRESNGESSDRIDAAGGEEDRKVETEKRVNGTERKRKEVRERKKERKRKTRRPHFHACRDE